MVEREKRNRLTLLRILPERSPSNHIVGEWGCECGDTTRVALTRVRNGTTKSCGCLNREASDRAHTTHGRRKTPEYSSWIAMNARCGNPRHKDYPRYGAKGITVCDEWRKSFESFFSHIGERPHGTTLDRIDWKKGYFPGNVRWATPIQQARNRADFVIVRTPLGVMPLVDYGMAIGLTKGAVHLRLKRGKLTGVIRV